MHLIAHCHPLVRGCCPHVCWLMLLLLLLLLPPPVSDETLVVEVHLAAASSIAAERHALP